IYFLIHLGLLCAAKGCRILLLDDVTASGATLVSAVRALRRAGYRSITVAVLGCRILR
ncbi:MAG: phosphoribosyltransferase, partial [Clostridia bacterium]|nr:phosphoribosyltransferase [Clostridia bacterium]